MICDLKPYPEMKGTSIPWLEELPAGWSVCRNGSLFVQRIETGFADLAILEVSLKTGVRVREFGGSSRKQIMEDRAKYKRASCGDVAYNMMRMWQGAVGVAPVDGLVSPAYVVARPLPGVLPHYFAYLFRTDAYMGEVDNYSRGIVKDRNRLYWEQFKQIQTPCPPTAEQAAIVRFLDHADRKIRRYIRAKQTLIKLLEEQKQVIIHRAVTGGLDPNVRLKPSGEEWLGDVPEHWEIRRVKSLSLVKRGASPRPIADQKYFDEGGEYAWVRIADVSASRKYLEETTQRLSVLGESMSVRLQPGALLLSIAGSVGKPIITKIKCCIHDGFVYFPQYHGNADFLYRVFSCGAPFGRLGKLGTQLNLNTDTVGGIRLGLPPDGEQGVIVAYLDEATTGIEQAVACVRREINLLHEYRTRLIADVVTGKLDVREAAAQLPDEEQEPQLLDDLDEISDPEEAALDDLDTAPEDP
ncbi:restriction endonuclease subunit S [Synechococcus sp. CBW1107]|jgi:type I restriction enzyme, S subunit|uniref:restriction endonuclease subunit S n=1 Tax=Synechococcus sp. CBW1107 TaxID=2789857 RepID=UPI0018CE302C|nr:restriction endonuclease subunit S [Synechococcus sp. CBW1107]QPN56255.1 restriction endonuclease subunit S [Synechococcus sp. CBW1107]